MSDEFVFQASSTEPVQLQNPAYPVAQRSRVRNLKDNAFEKTSPHEGTKPFCP
jgi:hypothetical protein